MISTPLLGQLVTVEILDPQPVMMAGAQFPDDGIPPDDLTYRVDENTADSPFAGVGSIGRKGVFRASGTLISRRHVLTAAHVVDSNYDGLIDIPPGELAFHLNVGGDSTHIYGIDTMVVHPDFTGFNRPTLNDDLAILTLDADVPPDVPVYSLLPRPVNYAEVLTLVGYGRSGYGDLGFLASAWENFNIKRYGQNTADIAVLDDEQGYYREVYGIDFDDPAGLINVVGGLSLGNLVETTLGFGDSGGPAFVWNDGQYQVAAVNTFIGRFSGFTIYPPRFGSAAGGILTFGYASWICQEASLEWTANTLALDVGGVAAYVQPGHVVTVKLDAINLAQRVLGVQAFVGFDTTYFSTAAGDVAVAPGGGDWTELIYHTFTVDGDLDMAIGVDLELEGGTDQDGTTAIIALTAAGEGITHLAFRPDADPDPGLVESTVFMAEDGVLAWPVKLDSADIIIDGTPPVLSELTAVQARDGEDVNVADCAATVIQGAIRVDIEAADSLAGLAEPPTLTVSGPGTLSVTSLPVGAPAYAWQIDVEPSSLNGTYSVTITATDRAGNVASDAVDVCVNTNQISGLVELEQFVGTGRVVEFVATGGSVETSWAVPLAFLDGVAPYVLTEVPDETTHLSAKTNWNLRRKIAVTYESPSQSAADFVDGALLLGGDLNDSNSVNILDFALLKLAWYSEDPIADINGDGVVQSLDYSLLKSNWFVRGDDD